MYFSKQIAARLKAGTHYPYVRVVFIGLKTLTHSPFRRILISYRMRPIGVQKTAL